METSALDNSDDKIGEAFYYLVRQINLKIDGDTNGPTQKVNNPEKKNLE